MVIPALVLGVCCVVILAGAGAELVEARRARVVPVGAGEARDRLLDEVDPRPVMAWIGLAAAAVLAPALVVGGERSVSDAALTVVVLGFAAERAGYLVRRTMTGRARAGWTAGVAALTVVGGVSLALMT